MKKPRIEDFDTKAVKERSLWSPLDGMPTIEKPRRVDGAGSFVPNGSTAELEVVPPPAQKQPARTTLNQQQDKTEKFDKYSTYLRPGYKKKIGFLANERECEKYEIVDEALTEYFAKLEK